MSPKRILLGLWNIAAPAGVVLAMGIAVLGTVDSYLSLFAGTGLSAERLIMLAAVLFIVFGGIIILRLDYRFSQLDEIYGDEHRRWLWRNGIQPFNETYLQYVRSADFRVLHHFWAAGFINIVNTFGSNDVLVACESGQAAVTKALIERGGDPRHQNRNGITPLIAAISHAKGSAAIVQTLMSYDCGINIRVPESGVTALHCAVYHANIEILQSLINNGADINQADNNNMTPIMYAVYFEKWDLFRCLAAYDSLAWDRKDKDGANILDYLSSPRSPPDLIGLAKKQGIQQGKPGYVRAGGGSAGPRVTRVDWMTEDELAKQHWFSAQGREASE